jgi:predicted permease
MFTRALEIVVTIFLMIGIGVFLSWRGKLGEPEKRFLSLLVVRVALPATILRSMVTQFDRAALAGSILPLLAALLAVGLCVPLALVLIRVLRIPKSRTGVFVGLIAFSNTVFIGFPIARAMLGEASIPRATLYYLANTVLFWTLGTALIRKDGQTTETPAGSDKRTDGLKNLLNPPLVTLFLSILLVLLDIRLPAFLLDTAEYVGGLVTPLSMLFIGSMLWDVFRRGVHWERGFSGVLATRFFLSPLLAMGLCALFGFDAPVRQSFLLQSGMSAMTQVAITAHAYHADSEYASLGVALTTCCLLLVLPVYGLLLPLL